MTSYAAWNMIGALANLFKNQGVNVLLNVFFGPVINTARGISVQIGVALNSFVTNIYMAIRPHITKIYASGDKEYMLKIVFQSAKFSYFLILIISMPVLLETNYIINIWLGKVPDYIVLFTKLIIFNILIETMNNQLVSALQAVGRIDKYQTFVSLLLILVLPVSYVFYYFGAEPEVSLYVSIVIAIISFVPQILITNLETGMSIKNYFNEVIFKMIRVSVIAYILPIIIINNMQPGLYRFIIILTTGFISCLLSIYFLGLIKGERIVIMRYINKISGRIIS
jgi:O-antigen/teichoic acid export membrane protein